MQYSSPFTPNVHSAPGGSGGGSGGAFDWANNPTPLLATASSFMIATTAVGVRERDTGTLLTQYCGIWLLLQRRCCSGGSVWSTSITNCEAWQPIIGFIMDHRLTVVWFTTLIIKSGISPAPTENRFYKHSQRSLVSQNIVPLKSLYFITGCQDSSFSLDHPVLKHKVQLTISCKPDFQFILIK